MFKYHLVTYFWIKSICKKADRLILLSEAMKKNADRFMGKFKMKNQIIPNACETIQFYPDYEKKDSVLKILFIGRLVAQKDPFTFLKSIKLLKEKIGDKFKVSILGDGPLRKNMQKFVEQNNLHELTEFKGWVSKVDMLNEYQSAHIQIISSKAEAMSIAALESLASGLYVISTPVSGNNDIIEEGINGDFFMFEDYKALAIKTEQYYNTKFQENYQIPENFLNDFRKKYDWSNIVNKLANILTENRI